MAVAKALSPVAQAEIVVDQSVVGELVESATEHHAIDCAFPDVCPGDAVTHVIHHEMSGGEARRLLALAVAELATHRRRNHG